MKGRIGDRDSQREKPAVDFRDEVRHMERHDQHSYNNKKQRIHGFPGLFTDASQHIRFSLSSFSLFHFLGWFRAAD